MLNWIFSKDLGPLLLLATGAITGSYCRFFFLKYLSSIFSSNYFPTFIVNITATFSLGLLIGLQPDDLIAPSRNSSLNFLLCAGFLGSLSTFSTFIIDLVNLLFSCRWRQFFSVSIISLLGGLCAVAAGIAIGGI